MPRSLPVPQTGHATNLDPGDQAEGVRVVLIPLVEAKQNMGRLCIISTGVIFKAIRMGGRRCKTGNVIFPPDVQP